MQNKINIKNTAFLSITFFCVIFLSNISIAQDDTGKSEKDPNKGLPKHGVLSSTYTAGDQSMSVDVWAKKGAAVDAVSPISGSVSRVSDKQWQMKVYNNTDDSFNADVRVKQINSRGNVIKTDSFSLRLKPKESTDRVIAGLSAAADAQLELVSWKRIVSTKVTSTEDAIVTPPATQNPAESEIKDKAVSAEEIQNAIKELN